MSPGGESSQRRAQHCAGPLFLCVIPGGGSLKNPLECPTQCPPCKDSLHPQSHPPLGLKYSPPPSSHKSLMSGAELPRRT